MVKLNACKKNNLCVDCKDKKCLGAGKIESDCPKYYCDNPNGHDCAKCEFIKQYQKDMREQYEAEKKKKYAFWRYDVAPFVLCGEVLEIREDGGVYVKGYDQNMTSYFRKEAIIAIMGHDDAMKYKKKLEKAKEDYDKAVKESNERFEKLKKKIEKHDER